MSFTETQVIHTLHRIRTASASADTKCTYNSNQGLECEETGMKVAAAEVGNTIGDTIPPVNPATVAGSPSQLPQCKLSSFSGLVLRTLFYFHNAHSAFILTIDRITGYVKSKCLLFFAVVLYFSLCLLAVQGVLIMMLLAQSLLPLGMWFLMTCISSMGGIFCVTSALPEPDPERQTKADLS